MSPREPSGFKREHFLALNSEANMQKLHQHRPQTATNHVSTTSMCNKEIIGRPIPEKTKEKKGDKPRNRSKNPKEQANDAGAKSPSGRKKGEKRKNKLRNPSKRNQEIMMEQNAQRIGRQAPDPYRNHKEAGNDDGTECQKNRETNPGTLPRARWNQEMMMEQNAKRPGRQAPEPDPEPD